MDRKNMRIRKRKRRGTVAATEEAAAAGAHSARAAAARPCFTCFAVSPNASPPPLPPHLARRPTVATRAA
eukprot:3055505-Pyramimonas_sp.AAC.1